MRTLFNIHLNRARLYLLKLRCQCDAIRTAIKERNRARAELRKMNEDPQKWWDENRPL